MPIPRPEPAQRATRSVFTAPIEPAKYPQCGDMTEFVTFTLNCTDAARILDELKQQWSAWDATVEYLKCGHTDLQNYVEKCSEPCEAQAMADYYWYLIDTIKKQLTYQITSHRSEHQDRNI